MSAQVMTCKVAQCSWNQSNQCNAPAITVNVFQNHADCETFHPKQSQ